MKWFYKLLPRYPELCSTSFSKSCSESRWRKIALITGSAVSCRRCFSPDNDLKDLGLFPMVHLNSNLSSGSVVCNQMLCLLGGLWNHLALSQEKGIWVLFLVLSKAEMSLHVSWSLSFLTKPSLELKEPPEVCFVYSFINYTDGQG